MSQRPPTPDDAALTTGGLAAPGPALPSHLPSGARHTALRRRRHLADLCPLHLRWSAGLLLPHRRRRATGGGAAGCRRGGRPDRQRAHRWARAARRGRHLRPRGRRPRAATPGGDGVPNPFPKTIYENVAYGLRIQGITKRSVLDEVVEKALRQAALWDEGQGIVTHNMQQASRVSDYTAFLYLGELVEYGPTDRIFIRPEKK